MSTHERLEALLSRCACDEKALADIMYLFAEPAHGSPTAPAPFHTTDVLRFFEQLPLAVMVRGLDDQRLLFANAAMHQLSHDEQLSIGQASCLHSVLALQKQVCLYCRELAVQLKAEPNRVFDWEVYHLGREEWYTVREWRLLWHDGRPAQLSLVRPRPDPHQEGSALALANESEKLHEFANVIVDASQNFRSALAVISTAAALLKIMPDTATEDREASHAQIQARIHGLTTLMDRLVMLAELESHAISLERGVKLYTVIEELMVRFVQPAHQRHIRVMVDTEPDLPLVVASRKYLLEAFSCLVDNAIKYNREGGRVDVGLQRWGDHLRFSVHDTGMGIEAEALPHIFAAFYRAKPYQKPAGLGLGLTIAKRIAEHHRAQLTCESTYGVGSRFVFDLPLAPP